MGEEIVRECDAYIAREKAKCRPKEEGKVKMPREAQAKCEQLEKKYAELVRTSEKVADESLSESKELMNRAIDIKEELETLKNKHRVEYRGEAICDICGVKYPLGMAGAALGHDETSHWRGKAHI